MKKPELSTLWKLEADLGCNWKAIREANQGTDAKLLKLQTLLQVDKKSIESEDTSLVAFGSLGRREWTSGSDLDWVLLIDGEADSNHLRIADQICGDLETAGFEEPGRTGTFGNMAFSHDLIHRIGGADDTNKNFTLRMLLLLESVAPGRDDAYRRVFIGILSRYVDEDASFLTPNGRATRIPRFLLNDIVRFWRTMAVDYARKQRDRRGESWALRNFKLRTSRKLLLASGMLVCFSCRDNASPELKELALKTGESAEPLVTHLKTYFALPPLEVLAISAILYRISGDTIKSLFTSYNQFLEILDNPEKRAELNGLSTKDVNESKLFEEARRIGRVFQDALTKFFFEENDELARATRLYGVF